MTFSPNAPRRETPWGVKTARHGSLVLGLAWIAVILFICLRPSGNESAAELGLCLICGEKGLASLLLNIILYIPLGFTLRRASGSWRIPLLVGAFLTSGVEISQLWIPGRHSSVADLVSNTSGTGMGIVLAATLGSWLRPRGSSGRPLALAALGLSLATVVATGALATPTIPGGGTLFGQWAPDLPTMTTYRGQVFTADVGGIRTPIGPLERSQEVARLLGEGAPVRSRFQWMPSPLGLAPVFRIVDENGEEAIHIGVRGTDLVVRPRYRASDLRLDRPEWRFPHHATPPAAIDTLQVDVRGAPGGGHWIDPGVGEPIRVGLTAGRGWSFLRSLGSLSERGWSRIDLLWLAGLLLPFGWWARSWRLLLSGGVLTLAALALTPLWTALLPTPAPHYVASLAGLLLGHGLRSGIERGKTREITGG